MVKILAVEDNPAILDFYREFFAEAGFVIETAEDALSAITKYQQFKPDVIILDLDIPAGGGMQVFERLRSSFNDPVPIIFSTGKPEKLPRLENLHNVSGLPKPVNPELLLAEVQKLTAAPAPEMNPVPPPPPSPELLRKAAAARQKARVLVVDDDFTILELYKDFLGPAGFEVQTAEDAVSALTRFQEFKPALIILDVDIPGGGGKSVFERLRIQLAAPTPIIFSTGSPKEVQALEKNMNVVVLKKPLVPATILEAIRKMLS
ncbi:MAG: hypothetical protein COT18_07310 [Elusimicrobia bacterium CG08_land_8_20_14_0_20_59_10]|nr:MAG: hypothetical protein COT18_07310 [Elusimicrobia bacterium CG08_land_8_20_14_0_20_59_10]